MSRQTVSARRVAFLDAINLINYRIEVCRREEAKWPPKSRGAATERSARLEAELLRDEIAKMANMPRRSRAFKEAAEKRAALSPSTATPRVGEADGL